MLLWTSQKIGNEAFLCFLCNNLYYILDILWICHNNYFYCFEFKCFLHVDEHTYSHNHSHSLQSNYVFAQPFLILILKRFIQRRSGGKLVMLGAKAFSDGTAAKLPVIKCTLRTLNQNATLQPTDDESWLIMTRHQIS